MFAFFDQIVGWLDMLGTMITSFFTSLGTLLSVIVNAFNFTSLVTIYFPGVLSAGIGITLAFAVVKFLVGR